MHVFLTVDFITELIFSMMRMSVPLLFAGLGELFSERAGLTNIGLEGLLTIGAVAGFYGSYISGSPWIGMLLGICSGVVLNLIFGYATVIRNGDQIVNGMALNILALGLASYFYRSYFGITSSPVKALGFHVWNIPLLSKIPIIGKGLFSHTPPVYLAFLFVPLAWFFLYKTAWGLVLRAVGEHPRSVDTLGVSVTRQKFFAVIVCGALCGMGGSYLTLAYMNMFMEGMVAGRGYIALATVIFGRWLPGGTMLAAMLFGFMDALQLRIQALGFAIPYQFLLMLPYLFTMLALIGFVGKSLAPAANGKPYYRESKL
jgi:simple sugar transport system permease protein